MLSPGVLFVTQKSKCNQTDFIFHVDLAARTLAGFQMGRFAVEGEKGGNHGGNEKAGRTRHSV